MNINTRKLLILMVLFWVAFAFCKHGVALAYEDRGSKEHICTSLAEAAAGSNMQIYYYNTKFSYSAGIPNKFKVLVPHTSQRVSLGFKNRQTFVDIKAALRYGSPPSNYHSNHDKGFVNYMAIPNPLNTGLEEFRNRGTKECWKEKVENGEKEKEVCETFDDTLIKAGGFNQSIFTVSQTPALESAGEYFYVNIFNDKDKIITMGISQTLPVAETLAWCEQDAIPTKPSKPTAKPSNGTVFTTPTQEISVTASGAQNIYFRVTDNSDISSNIDDPKEPGEPDKSDNFIKGSAGKIPLSANQGEYKKFKISLRAENDQDWSATSNYQYAIDRLPKEVGEVKVSPESKETQGTSIDLTVTAPNANEIRYIVKSIENGVSEDLEDPSEEETRSSNQKISEKHTLKTDAGTEKIFKLRFVGYNGDNPESEKFGPVSQVYTYRLKGSEIQPGEVSVEPGSGHTFTSREELTVTSSNSERIYYSFSGDGSDPGDPRDQASLNSTNGPVGKVQIPGSRIGERITLKMRFIGHNSQTREYGPLSSVYTYTVDLRNDGSGNDGNNSSNKKRECEAKGGTWVPIINDIGYCDESDKKDEPTTNLTRSQARSNPGADVTPRIYNPGIGDYDPAKPFFNSDAGNDLKLVDVIDIFLNPDYQSESKSNNSVEFRTLQNRLTMDFQINENLSLQAHMAVEKIETTANDSESLDINEFLVFNTQNLVITLRFVSGDWEKLSYALAQHGYHIQNEPYKHKGVMKFSSYSPELGKAVSQILRPSYTQMNKHSCTFGELKSDGNGLFICYESPGKWQSLIPYVYHYDEFVKKADSDGVNILLDPFTGLLRFEGDGLIWKGMPGPILEPDENTNGYSFRYQFIEDMTGNGYPEILLIKNGYRQIIYILGIVQ